MACRKPRRRGPDSRRLTLALLLGATVSGCRLHPLTTVTPLPSPTPTIVAPSSRETLDVETYLLIVRPVTSDFAILNARDQPSQVLEALVEELELIEPPPEMAEAHALLKEGYQLLAEGTALLETQPDSALRSEAVFNQDWGLRQLWEHRRRVTEVLTEMGLEGLQ